MSPRDVRPKLALYETGIKEPRAWLDGDGRLTPEGPHPRILFAHVPVMMHLTCGISVAPLSDAEEEPAMPVAEFDRAMERWDDEREFVVCMARLTERMRLDPR